MLAIPHLLVRLCANNSLFFNTARKTKHNAGLAHIIFLWYTHKAKLVCRKIIGHFVIKAKCMSMYEGANNESKHRMNTTVHTLK